MTGSSFIKTTGTADQPAAGQMPLLEFSRQQKLLNKLLAGTFSRGNICSFDANGDVIADGGAGTNKFMVALEDGIANQPKANFAIEGAAVLVKVAATKTASYNVDQVVSASSLTQDRAAEAANKVWGTAMGTIDQQDGKVLQTDVAAGGLVLVKIKPWVFIA